MCGQIARHRQRPPGLLLRAGKRPKRRRQISAVRLERGDDLRHHLHTRPHVLALVIVHPMNTHVYEPLSVTVSMYGFELVTILCVCVRQKHRCALRAFVWVLAIEHAHAYLGSQKEDFIVRNGVYFEFHCEHTRLLVFSHHLSTQVAHTKWMIVVFQQTYNTDESEKLFWEIRWFSDQ